MVKRLDSQEDFVRIEACRKQEETFADGFTGPVRFELKSLAAAIFTFQRERSREELSSAPIPIVQLRISSFAARSAPAHTLAASILRNNHVLVKVRLSDTVDGRRMCQRVDVI